MGRLRLRCAGLCSAVSSASDSRAGDPRFDTKSGHILSFLLPMIQVGQLSVTGESMCTKYWFTALESLSLPRKSVVRLTDSPKRLHVKQHHNRLRCMGTSSWFPPVLKGKFAYLDDKTCSKGDLLLKEIICSWESKFLNESISL